MALTDFSLNKVRLFALVRGVEIELTRVELRYYLNAISEAVLHCAVGREVKGKTLEPAAIHGIFDTLKVNEPVTVFCDASEVTNSGISGGAWPAGEFIVFDGIIVGAGYRKARSGSATLTLSCKHFLVDLEFSYTPNRTSHPLNQDNFRGQAGLKMAAGEPHFNISTLARKHFTRAKVTADYWGLSLKPWLEEICNQRQIFENEAVERGNDDAILTLNRIEPFVEGGYRFGVPLSMVDFAVFGNRAGADSIVTDASNEGLRSFLGASIWEKIVSDFGSRYLFSVVPMATRGIVAPVIPGLFAPDLATGPIPGVWTVIDPVEYDNVALTNFLPRPLRGVILETGSNSMVGAPGFVRGQGRVIKTIGGRFENANMDEGLLLFREAPQWIANILSQTAFGRGAAAPNKVKGNAFAGVAGVGPIVDIAAQRDNGKVLWDEYAKAIYLYEVFKTRRGMVTGRIRFDIAPGSSVGLITTEEKFVSAATGLGSQTLFGVVTGVTIMIDSEAVQGYTSLEISYLRDEAENLDVNLTTDAHPLWSEPFLGAPLVEELFAQFPPVI